MQGGLLATLYSVPTPYLTILVDEREEEGVGRVGRQLHRYSALLYSGV